MVLNRDAFNIFYIMFVNIMLSNFFRKNYIKLEIKGFNKLYWLWLLDCFIENHNSIKLSMK